MAEYLTYEQVEAIVNDPSSSPEERASYVHAYIEQLLPAHFERCPFCAVTFSPEEVIECLSAEELLAPFIDWLCVTPGTMWHIVLMVREQRGAM